MNHLGGMEGMVCVEWSCKSSMLGETWDSPSPACWGKLGVSLVDGHPGTKGPTFSPSEDASRAAISHMGSG